VGKLNMKMEHEQVLNINDSNHKLPEGSHGKDLRKKNGINLLNDIQQLIDVAKQHVASTVNAAISILYWQVGQRIKKEELKDTRAEYGKQTITRLAHQLTEQYGRGWGARHLRYCLKFAEIFPDFRIVNTLCSKLSWSHFRLLMAMDDSLKRDFYIEMCRLERWSVRRLQERVDSMLYERTALSRNPEETIKAELTQLADEGEISSNLVLKDPYILDFLDLNDRYVEKDLEDAILREMEQFLLELGAGFSFLARQKRMQIDEDDFYLDLLFYNRKLHRLVAIDLKMRKFKHEYKSQMELYLRWLAKYEQEEGEASPLGLILCTGKKKEQIELLELDKSGIHVAEYITVLPSKELLQKKLYDAIKNSRLRLGNSTEDQE